MKSRYLMFTTALALFAALALPVRLAAQDSPDHHRPHHHYQLIDLGTLGGPASYISSPVNFVPALNLRGTPVGASGTTVASSSTSDSAVCGGFEGTVPNVFHAIAWQKGVVTDLGSLAGADYGSDAASTNARGEIEGLSEIGILDTVLGFNELGAVLWKDGKITDHGRGNAAIRAIARQAHI